MSAFKTPNTTAFAPIANASASTEPPPASHADPTVTEFLQTESVSYTDAVTLALLMSELRAGHAVPHQAHERHTTAGSA